MPSHGEHVHKGATSRQLTIHHIIVFILTFMGYAYFHATRKCFSNVKDTISEEWTPTFSNSTVNQTLPNKIWNSQHLFGDKKAASVFLGGLDSAFLVSYAVGLYISGFVGDRINIRYVLTFGMCTSAICVFLFGTLSEWLHLYSTPYYMIFWLLNGFLQASGWPAMVAVMANWFGRSSRGFVMGAWSACASVGNIIGALVASGVLDFGYQYVFLVPASMLFGCGIIMFFGLVPHPNEIGLRGPDEEEENYSTISNQEDSDCEPLFYGEGQGSPEVDEALDTDLLDGADTHTQSAVPKRKAMGFLKAILLPGVIPYSLSYACLKLVNYAFFFWLPFYMTSKYGWKESTADEISIWYDVGGIFGGAVGGFISDRLRMRATVVTVMLFVAFPAIYGYSLSPDDMTINSVLMGVTGFWIGGPANLISSAISADIGKDASVAGNQEALATVTGIVDGTGSLGGALGQILIPILEISLGWEFVFYMFMVMTALTIICIVPMQLKEIRSMRCYQNAVQWYQRRQANAALRHLSPVSPESTSEPESAIQQNI